MKHLIFVFGLLVICLLSNARGQIVTTDTSNTNHSQSEYEKWIAPYRLNTVGRQNSLEAAPLKLAISVITDNKPPENTNKIFFLGPPTFSYGSKVSVEGEVSSFRNGSLSNSGGCCSQIEKDELKQIDQLLANLPDDNSLLPPNGRRLLLQVANGDKFTARVYDLANAPDQILELLRLTKSNIRSYVLSLSPQTQWTAYDKAYKLLGIAITSDGKKIISSGEEKSIKIWDAKSQSLLQEVINPAKFQFNGIILSPDDKFALIQKWGTIDILNTKNWNYFLELKESVAAGKSSGLFNPQFINNGKFLLLESTEPALRIYDTKNWKQRSILPEIPADAVTYHPSPDNSYAVYSLKTGQIILRDILRRRNIATLDNSGIQKVSFSPDKSLVAVVISQPRTEYYGWKYKIRIWKTKNGELLKELRPFEQDVGESIEGLMWSPNGKYILAASQYSNSRGISIWNVKSGRHRAELLYCSAKLTGFAYFANKTKMMTSCQEGAITIWDLSDTFTKIGKFEESLFER